MPVARIDTDRARLKLQAFDFPGLFIEELGWNQPSSRKASTLEHEGIRWRATEVSQLSSFRVFEVTSEDRSTAFPDTKTQLALWKLIALHSVENVVIFVDSTRTRSLWLWMKREDKRQIPRRHHFLKGQPGDLFLSKLAALFVDLSELDEEGNVNITAAKDRVQKALDIEAVTKVFFRDFQEEHLCLLDQIKGIPDGRERRWYASVLLNRLMFVWFLQAKGFLDNGNHDYLPELLAASKKKASGKFFSHVLRDLFFEGLAKPNAKRQCSGPVPLGDIPYLNGGLFLPHGIEQRIESDTILTTPYAKIKISDTAFSNLFELFSRYSWSLNDTPGGKDDEINPDVLGYIFEKYINQKEFGAYYTRPEITEYLCEQTIHQLLLDRANEGFDAGQVLHAKSPKTFSAPRKFATIDDLLFHADGQLCTRLLQDVLPRFSLLDPACGSGAFLVAAQKTLLNLYTALIGRCDALGHRPVLDWLEREKAKHKAPVSYWLKKKIVTENLFGVDIMEEATEIAKLRLFLSLVASAEKRDQLEPLPNIEFNILPGNSLIGLLHVDAAAFDRQHLPSSRQGRLKLADKPGDGDLGFDIEISIKPTQRERDAEWLASLHSKKYGELLAEKNRRIAIYRQATAYIEDLVSVKRGIEQIKDEARAVLDRLLFSEFQHFDIQFLQATWDQVQRREGKPERRQIRLDDIRALQPFHWGYEFDEILINRGGFDAIITNPPWEIFKPNSKEFFQQHSDLVTKNSMRIEDFEEEKAEILKDSEVRKAWLDYLSSYPHVSEWFRSSPQFANQISIVNGKKAGSDINLYKLFTEQCVNLLHAGGHCGIVIPSGIYTDLGAKQLRLMLFERTRITGLFGFENRKAIFEGVDSRFKFVVLSYQKGGATTEFPVAFMRHDPPELATFPEAAPLKLSRALVERLTPDTLSLMEFKSKADVAIAEKLLQYPLLGERVAHSWNVSFTAEFHMTNDSDLFQTSPGKGRLPLYEGKMVWQFQSPYAAPRYWVDEREGRKRALGRTADVKQTLDYQCYRLGFRDIARNTDTRTLICSVIPPSFHGNKLPTVKVRTDAGVPLVDTQTQLALCAIWNSFVLDWMIRQKVTTTLNFFYLFQLPIPRLTIEDVVFRPLVERTARLVGTSGDFDDLLREVFGPKATHRTHGATSPVERQRLRAELDALVAQLYRLTEDEFTHILGTFPLVETEVKTATLAEYRKLVGPIEEAATLADVRISKGPILPNTKRDSYIVAHLYSEIVLPHLLALMPEGTLLRTLDTAFGLLAEREELVKAAKAFAGGLHWAKSFGQTVSRADLRAALLRLVERGIVHAVPKSEGLLLTLDPQAILAADAWVAADAWYALRVAIDMPVVETAPELEMEVLTNKIIAFAAAA